MLCLRLNKALALFLDKYINRLKDIKKGAWERAPML
jgi:hypothetical protein